jgi:hypothetical protein
MSSTIRPIANGIFRCDDRILVGHGHDVLKGERFCRPPGGAIEFGERAAEALRCEIREEVRAEIAEPHLLAVLKAHSRLRACQCTNSSSSLKQGFWIRTSISYRKWRCMSRAGMAT